MHHSIRTPFFSCDFVRKPRHSSTIPAFSSASHGKNSRFAGACLTSLAPLVLYKLSFLSPSFPHSTHSTHSTPVQKDLTTPACPHATPILLFNPFLLCVPSVTLLLCVTFLLRSSGLPVLDIHRQQAAAQGHNANTQKRQEQAAHLHSRQHLKQSCRRHQIRQKSQPAQGTPRYRATQFAKNRAHQTIGYAYHQ